jgi:Cu(I)/Ag(I) efflux system membrane fusion protein
VNRQRAWTACVTVFFVGTVALSALLSHSGSTAEETAVVQQTGKNRVKVADAAKANLPLVTAASSEYPDQIDVTGKISVTENGTTVIPARATGRVQIISVASGEPVESGQAVAKIYSPDFAAAREEYLQASKRKSDENKDFSLLRAMSSKKLESLGLSKEDIAGLGKSDPNLLVVRTPVAGVIIDKKAVLGSAVNVGDALFTIGDLHKVWFLGDLYPEDLPKVHAGQDVVMDPPIAGGTPIRGKVSFISPVIDPNTRTIKIRVLMENLNLALRGDMYMQAHIVLSTHSAILVPSTAVFNEEGKDYVFRQAKNARDTYEKAMVKAGAVLGDQTVIAEGINTGDVIVADGSLLLNSALSGAGVQ